MISSNWTAARAVSSTPLIASGGAGSKEDFKSVFELAKVDGALAASVFHKGVIGIGELKVLDQVKESG